MIKNVLPFFLNGGVQNLGNDATDTAWDGKSSFVNAIASGAKAFTLGVAGPDGRPVKPGTMVVVMKTDANSFAITVNPTPDIEGDAGTVELNGDNQTCLLMFKAPFGANDKGEWVILAKDADTTFTGGTVGANTVFSGDVEIEGNVGFYDTAPIARQALAADGTDAATTQALANDIKVKLIALGLCA
jgi:hypothetical protein